MQEASTFNRHMMALARDSRGLTQSGLAAKIGVKQGTISKYEAGILAPPSEFIDDLSLTLNYLCDFFFESGRPYGMPPFHYRRRKKLGVKALSKMIAEMNIRRIHLQILLKSYAHGLNSNIPEIDRDEYRSRSDRDFSIEAVACRLRELWMLPSGPIENVTDLLEEHGGIVISCNFDSDLIDAVSQRIDGLPILFFVNANAPADRIRHTLCHELAHMVLHTTSFLDDDDMEREADIFAGMFLVPPQTIRGQLSRFDLRQVTNLKRYWKVSMASIVMQADRLNLITPYQKKMFFIQMGRLGYRKAEPHEPPKEYPRKIQQIINYYRSVLGYSKEEIATILYISTAEFDRMYAPMMPTGLQSPESHWEHGLRLVK